MNITFKQLRYFEAVAKAGHFGRAAAHCAISQPAISVQIKELEETLGTKLFERTAKQVRLTTFGTEFSVRARDILQRVDDLDDLARTSQKGMIGKLRIGVIPTIAPYLLPKIIRALALSYPELDVHIRESQTDTLISELKEGRLDTAILALPISVPFLTEVPLFEEHFVLVRNLADADKPVPNSQSLSEMRLLLLEEGHCFRDQALSFCSLQSNVPRDSMEGSSLATLVQMVGIGIGVTLIPEMAVAVETRSAPVSVAHFDDPQPARSIGMVWRKTSPLTAHLKELSQVVLSASKPPAGGVSSG